MSTELIASLMPSYARRHYPIEVSGSDNQAASWAAFFVDCHFTILFLPVGINLIFSKLNEANIFIITYTLTSIYCSATQITSLGWLCPGMCIVSGLVLTHYGDVFYKNITELSQDNSEMTKKQRDARSWEERSYPMKKVTSSLILSIMCAFLISSVWHSMWIAAKSYSEPTIFLSATAKDGSVVLFDDFRESLYWLRENTPENSTVISWSDHGYQINSMAQRATISDNSAWNKTQMAVVGDIFSSNEQDAYPLLTRLNANYVMVTFGGMVAWSGDDINKFLWMCRIAGKKESDFKNPNGEFRVDHEASRKWTESVLYKLSYYRYGQLSIESGRPTGWDRVRRAEVGNKDFALDTLEEVYTSRHWLVRLYKVKKLDNLGNPLVL